MSKKKILVVDDARHVVMMLKSRLEANGYQVISAHNGKDALQTSTKDKPGLILLDYALPDMNGNEVVQELKKGTETGGIPIIMVSGMKDDRFSKFSADKRIDAFISKPFSPDELLATVKKLIG